SSVRTSSRRALSSGLTTPLSVKVRNGFSGSARLAPKVAMAKTTPVRRPTVKRREGTVGRRGLLILNVMRRRSRPLCPLLFRFAALACQVIRPRLHVTMMEADWARRVSLGAIVPQHGRNAKSPTCRNLGVLSFEDREQPVDERSLAGKHSLPRLVDAEPRGAIDLGEGLDLPALRRPFHLESIGFQSRWVKIALNGEGRDELPARLPDLAEHAVVSCRRRC